MTNRELIAYCNKGLQCFYCKCRFECEIFYEKYKCLPCFYADKYKDYYDEKFSEHYEKFLDKEVIEKV